VRRSGRFLTAVAAGLLLAGRVPLAPPRARPGGQQPPAVPIAALRNPTSNAPYPHLGCHGFSLWTPVAGWRGEIQGPCVWERTASGPRLRYDPLATERLMLQAIDAARAREGLGPLALPVNFRDLPAPVQLLVLTDRERTSRGLPPVAGTSPSLLAAARAGAAAARDPLLAATATAWGSIWASSSVSNGLVLGAWFGWMYADGWDGAATHNLSCTSPRAPGCWGHRDTILGAWGPRPAVGAAASSLDAHTASYTMIFAPGAGHRLEPPPAPGVSRQSTNPWVLFP
jgi:hypothetical protein